ncbi:uncharacterized protein LOC122944649 [Bufo gargarizans]|uniref:uncharacterized protein LOC122944649 n=1 Tax=Bufo gargarizans TaxID=30331 RepID=UPI001CF2A594|nr:uncharacterized protein LOC122944649 [Bufo gargarizans]
MDFEGKISRRFLRWSIGKVDILPSDGRNWLKFRACLVAEFQFWSSTLLGVVVPHPVYIRHRAAPDTGCTRWESSWKLCTHSDGAAALASGLLLTLQLCAGLRRRLKEAGDGGGSGWRKEAGGGGDSRGAEEDAQIASALLDPGEKSLQRSQDEVTSAQARLYLPTPLPDTQKKHTPFLLPVDPGVAPPNCMGLSPDPNPGLASPKVSEEDDTLCN